MTRVHMRWTEAPPVRKGKHSGVRVWTCGRHTIVYNPANDPPKRYLLWRTAGGYLFTLGFSRSLASAKTRCRRDAERHDHR